ncbi:MAG: YtxH domain-containing protein [Deltaproteobacteria bacterium]|jgi:gas vesicle protein
MHHKEESCSSGVAVLSFLTGTAIGAAIALLLAPRSGRETREMITEYGTDFKDRAVDEIRGRSEDTIERGRNMIERGKEMISRGTEMANQGREYLDEKKKALSSAIEAGREAIQREKEKLTSEEE